MPGTELLHQLVADAGLAPVRSCTALSGHGFDHEILRATLVDGREIVLRHRPDVARPLPIELARFLAAHDVPAPALLGGNDRATLYEFVPGEMLSALVAEQRMTDDNWRSVGTTFRRLHDIRFPAGLTGVLRDGRLELAIADPVRALHELLVGSEPWLQANLPIAVPHLAQLHEAIDARAGQLREAPTALLHWDVNPANVIVGPERTALIDWGDPWVGDPAQEIAALEEHVYLINGSDVPAAFFETYGPRPANTALHRLTGAIGWLSSGDFEEWEDLAPELKVKADRWQAGLVTYLSAVADHLHRL
ncbi:aminoglycoside phosphotransferase [Kribbella flavida DSM 17836]|uniref:Aminoglycoside phosphotransferase n=1 Tax=Kribbella flavida (strain DSM 17836 / JCM 10339 / NBRC 14399) TaxID=479435 RepID=D2PKK9_KRIFD|nr:aminoglycoside phosphotransferase family protein [Kribbella flavida]ADB30521.1 aminoglycoside phosphotransferase [Kribbella flavida DSM 17836]